MARTEAVSGHPYYDTIAIKVVNDHSIEETDKKNGKVVANSTSTVSSDGNTLMFTFSDSSNTNGGPPVTGKGEATVWPRGRGARCDLRFVAYQQDRRLIGQCHRVDVQSHG